MTNKICVFRLGKQFMFFEDHERGKSKLWGAVAGPGCFGCHDQPTQQHQGAVVIDAPDQSKDNPVELAARCARQDESRERRGKGQDNG